MSFATELRSVATARGLPVSLEAAEAMEVHARRLQDWNRAAKLTSHTDEREILERHFLESLEALRFVSVSARRLVDVGPGGGFPSLPLLVCRADLLGELLEPNARKRAFLKEVVRSLGLGGRVTVRRDRVDRAGDLDVLEPFDVLTSRAVGPLELLLAAAVRRLRPGGQALLYAGEAGRSIVPPPGLALRLTHPLPGRDASYLLVFQVELGRDDPVGRP